jgi:GxxExxY protein
MRINEVTGVILNEAIRVHRELGPGLLESVYEAVLAKRLQQRGLSVDRQKPITITIDGEVYGEAFRIDLLVDGIVIVELKSVETLHPVHFKQGQDLPPTNKPPTRPSDQLRRRNLEARIPSHCEQPP